MRNNWISLCAVLCLVLGCSSVTQSEEVAESGAGLSSYDYVYLYGLSGFRFADLIGPYHARVMVVDADDSKLTAPQLQQLKAKGSTVFSYLSIGEAESYRDYWQGWRIGAPDFVLEENANWKGNYRVKFWDEQWQHIIFSKAKKIAELGYDGVYLDIIDGYQQAAVKRAYQGSDAALRQEMEEFVIRLSRVIKAVNPEFKVIPQNAVELLTRPGTEAGPNLPYLQAIDGIGVESLWYSDNQIADWTRWDLQKIKLAQRAGKFVLATSYPTDHAKQLLFLEKAKNEGLIPFVGKRALSKQAGVPRVNQGLMIDVLTLKAIKYNEL